MDIKLINVGYGNFISSSRIIAIIGPESAPVKRIIQEARGAQIDRRDIRQKDARCDYFRQRSRHLIRRAAGDHRSSF